MVFDREGVNNPTDEPTISTDTKPTMYERVRNHPGFDWAVRIIIAVIIIAVIVFGGRWLHHKLQNKDNGTVPASTKQLPAAPPTSNSKTTSGNSASNNKNTGSTGNSSSNNQKNTASNSGPALKNGQNLADTGPGAVIAIFIAASFAAASLHYAYELRKSD